MRWNDAADQYCSVARTLGILGDRWTLLIVREAFNGVRRFDDFRGHLGMARNVLTDRLQRLVEAQILERREYQDAPIRYEYRLTERGKDLQGVLISLMRWGDRWLAGEKGPPLALEHTSCGHAIAPLLICPDCREPLDARNVRLVAGPGLPKTVARSREAELRRLRTQHGATKEGQSSRIRACGPENTNTRGRSADQVMSVRQATARGCVTRGE